MIWSEKNVLLI